MGCSGKIVIGNNVMIGPRVSLFAESHNFSDIHSSIKSQGVNNKGITIEDDCWIGRWRHYFRWCNNRPRFNNWCRNFGNQGCTS